MRYLIFSLCLTACVSVSSVFSDTASAAVVLFDQSHGQRFVASNKEPLGLSSFASRFAQAGYEVRTAETALSPETLATADVLVISGPFSSYGPGELDAIAAFVEKGGGLAVMLHIAQPVAELLERFGVDFSNGVIHERENVIDNNPINFKARKLENHPVTEGVQEISFYGAWALSATSGDVAPIASSSASSWIDLDLDRALSAADAVQSFAVAVAGTAGSGRFVIFGDDAPFQNKFMDQANTQVADNLARWLQR